jgi:hypothetical protein
MRCESRCACYRTNCGASTSGPACLCRKKRSACSVVPQRHVGSPSRSLSRSTRGVSEPKPATWRGGRLLDQLAKEVALIILLSQFLMFVVMVGIVGGTIASVVFKKKQGARRQLS